MPLVGIRRATVRRVNLTRCTSIIECARQNHTVRRFIQIELLVICAHAGIENVSVNGPPFRTHIVGPVVRPERRLVETIEMPKILAIPCGVLRSGENEMKILFDQLYAWIVRETGDRSVGCTIADEATCPLGPS